MPDSHENRWDKTAGAGGEGVVSAGANAVECDVAVIGAGMAGLCAALFAGGRGLSTVQVGGCGEIVYAAGAWDLLGVHPLAEQKRWSNPWSAIAALTRDLPDHPYARLTESAIRAAFAELLSVFDQAGYPYRREPEQNCELITPVGTVKTTYCVPYGMWNGVLAWRSKSPTVLVDFAGLKDFSARQIVANLQDKWPALSALRISFPGHEQAGELSTEYIARSLDFPAARARLAAAIKPLIGEAKAVGLPAVLGFNRSKETVDELQSLLGRRYLKFRPRRFPCRGCGSKRHSNSSSGAGARVCSGISGC